MRQLFCIDISGVEVQPEPMGRGYQAWVEGDRTRWARGETVDEAVGGLIRRLAVEHEGANWRREQQQKDERSDPGFTHELEAHEVCQYLLHPTHCNLWRTFWLWLRKQAQEGRIHIGVMVLPEEEA